MKKRTLRRLEEAAATAKVVEAVAPALAVPVGLAAAGVGLAALSVYPRLGYHVGRGIAILSASVVRGVVGIGEGFANEIVSEAQPAVSRVIYRNPAVQQAQHPTLPTSPSDFFRKLLFGGA